MIPQIQSQFLDITVFGSWQNVNTYIEGSFNWIVLRNLCRVQTKINTGKTIEHYQTYPKIGNANFR